MKEGRYNFNPVNEYEKIEIPIKRNLFTNKVYLRRKFQTIEKRALLSIKLIKYIGKGGYGAVNLIKINKLYLILNQFIYLFLKGFFGKSKSKVICNESNKIQFEFMFT